MSEAETLRRSFLPEIMLPPDVAVALQVQEHEARRMMELGQLGRAFKVGCVVGVLRSEFIAKIRRASRAMPEVIA